MLKHLVMFKYFSVKNCVPLSETTSLCHIEPVSVTDSLCLSLTVCVCHRHSVSVIDSLFLPQTVYVCQRQLLSVTENLCLSKKVCVCQRQYVFVTDSLCLSQKVFVCQSVSLLNTCFNYPWPDFHLFIHDFHQDLSVIFQYVRDFNPINANFVDPCLP